MVSVLFLLLFCFATSEYYQALLYLRITGNFKGEGKGKVHRRTGHEGPEGV